MAMQDDEGDFYFCELKNGMEHDLFIDFTIGQISFEFMSHNKFEFNQKDHQKITFKISNHLFIFDNKKILYKSLKNLEDLLKEKRKGPKTLIYEKDFSKLDIPSHNFIVNRGPFAFGINLKKKLVYAYDCNKEKVFELENQDIFGESENDKYLTKHSII